MHIRFKISTDTSSICDSLVEKIEEALRPFPCIQQDAELVFSAHSVPLAVIEKGDPYQRQIEETVELLMRRGALAKPPPSLLSEQSGRQQMAAAVAAHDTCGNVAASGARDICVVPVSFVSDHVETLGEIDHEARAEAAALGIRQFEMTSGLNDSPTFIAALAELVGGSHRN